MNILRKRYEWIASQLQREAYAQQMAGRTKPLKQFFPCEKGLVFTAAMAKLPTPVTMEVIPLAALTVCGCHPVGEDVLWKLFDEAGKELTK